MTKIPLIDHIGWDLWRAADAWKALFTTRMVQEGYPWFAGARGSLVPLIGRAGISQNDLAKKAGMTKQAIQQHLDTLEADGIITRKADQKDARRKHVAFTEEGLQALAHANTVKEAIEATYQEQLGTDTLETLRSALAKIADTKA